MTAVTNTSSAASATRGLSGRFTRLSAPVARMGQWVRDIGRRSAVINELDRLSDRELADIGLNRAEIRTIFSMANRVAR